MPYLNSSYYTPPKSLIEENAIRTIVLRLASRGFTQNQISTTIVKQQPVDLDLLNEILRAMKL